MQLFWLPTLNSTSQSFTIGI